MQYKTIDLFSGQKHTIQLTAVSVNQKTFSDQKLIV